MSTDRTIDDGKAETPGRLGLERAFHWTATEHHVDMATPPVPARRLTIDAEWQSVTVDLNRTAIVIIDMQNDFCTKDGWVDTIGGEFECNRAPIKPLQRLLPVLRSADVPVIWVNWGNRPDLLNMPPNQIHLYKPHGTGIGLGEPLPKSGAEVLQKDSWAAAVVDEIAPLAGDVRIDKHRISGFWDTPLDSILKNLDIRSIFFAGVNIDQCVMCTLQDANFLGYGCILVEDCCATSSPDFCTEATVWNVKKCFGFVTGSAKIIEAAKAG